MDAAAPALALALLLLVCAHFQMTQALIKIIIAAAPRRGSTVEAAQIKTWFKQASAIRHSSYQQSRVIMVINTGHKKGDRDRSLALWNQKGVEQLAGH